MNSESFATSMANLMTDDPAENVHSIKNAVAARLVELDPGVSVRATDYFNHTFAPDLVLKWPGDPAERHVFLRTSSNPGYLCEDLVYIAKDHPIVMPLSAVPRWDGGEETSADSLLAEQSSEARTLVADPDSLAPLEDERADRPVLGLLSRAVLQGGRGLVDEKRARETGRAVDAGFLGARTADINQTGRAVNVVHELLDEKRAAALTGILHAVWMGSGAPATSFPGATGITTALDPQGLRFILTLEEITDRDFWRRLGAGLSLEILVELGSLDDNTNFRRLVNANLSRLRARSCRVVEDPHASDRPALSWYVDSRLLVLAGRSYRAYFSPFSLSEMTLPELEEEGISVRALQTRARDSGIELGDIELAVRDRRVELSSESAENLANDPLLESLGDSLGPEATVRSTIAYLGGGARHIKCDFVRRSASGRTGAKFHLTEMLTTAVPLLHRLSPSERDHLTLLVAVGENE